MTSHDVVCITLLYFILFQVKHFLSDFIFQTKYMLGKFKPFPGYIMPLAAHSFVQAVGTFWVLYVMKGTIDSVVLFFTAYDFATHFIIDRLKASPNLLGRFKVDQPYFWWALGFDQMLHQFIYLQIIFFAMLK